MLRMLGSFQTSIIVYANQPTVRECRHMQLEAPTRLAAGRMQDGVAGQLRRHEIDKINARSVPKHLEGEPTNIRHILKLAVESL